MDTINIITKPVPVKYGGTGAENAYDALKNLKGLNIPDESITTLPNPIEMRNYKVINGDSSFPNSTGLLEIKLNGKNNEFIAVFYTGDNSLSVQKIYYNFYSNGNWAGWKEIFQITNGKMTSPLTIEHMDGLYIYRKDNISPAGRSYYKTQFSLGSGGYSTITRWKRDATDNADVHLSSLYFGDKYLAIHNKADNKTYEIYGEHNLDKFRNNIFIISNEDLTPGVSTLENGKIYLVYE